MKNIFMGIVGIFITVYFLLIGLDIYTIQTQKNALEEAVSHAVEHALENYYIQGNEVDAISEIEQEIARGVSGENEMEVNVKSIDLEKGLISITVTERVSLITGGVKQIILEKTAIVERVDTKTETVMVTFYVDGEVYKEYQLTKGEVCPMPKTPGGIFSGWVEYGSEKAEIIEHIGQVWEDKVYLAIVE